MSQHVDRNQVCNTTKVRTSLKNDGSWIQRSKPEKDKQDKAQTDLSEETGPAEVKQKSYVLSTAKIFESADDPVSPPPKPTTEGASVTLANGEVILPQEDFLPRGSTVETTDDTKPQAPKEEQIQNGEAQPVNAVADTAEENKEGPADAPVDQSNAEDKESTSEVSACIPVQNEELTFSSTKENPEQPVVTEDTVEAVAVVVVESSHDTSEGIHATPGGKAPLQNRVEPIPDLLYESLAKSFNLHAVPESLNQSAANATDEPEESNVEAAAPAEAGLKTRADQVPESEVQPVNDLSPESAAEPVEVELDSTDAVEPVAASEGGAVQNGLSDGGIELTDALDVELPTTEAAPEPADNPEQPQAEQNQSSDTKSTDTFQTPREEQQYKYTPKETSDGKAICSFCDQIIDGRIKISLSEPQLTCHAECLKCGVCAQGLGELLIPMFLRDQLIHCSGCFFSRR